MKILVTGAAGFVGWKTCELLCAGGHTVVGVDNLNSYYDVNLKHWRLSQLKPLPGFSFYPVDIESKGALQNVFEAAALSVEKQEIHSTIPPAVSPEAPGGFDAVINLGARAGVRSSVENPEIYYATNVIGSLHLLELMREFGVKKYVLASTSSLYAGQPLPFSEDQLVSRPMSPYAASKSAAETMAYTWHHLYGIDVTVLRFFTVYGPAGRPDMSPLRFIRLIDEGSPITLFGDGRQTRDFTYIDDVARGTIAALKPLGFEIVNLGGGNHPVSIRSMIDTFARYLGKTPVIEEQAVDGSDMRETQAVIEKARALLDWIPEVEPEEGFRRTVEWYLKHRDLVRSLAH